MSNTDSRKPIRLRTALTWIAAIAIIGTGLFLWGNHSGDQRDAERAAVRDRMANSEIVYAADPMQKLAKRTDGSYYTKTKAQASDIVTYDYTTIEDRDVVVSKSVSTTERGPRPFLWFNRNFEFTNDITVRVIDSHETDQRPRLERLRCTVKPIDPSKPSYTGDPHATSRSKIGSDEMPPVPEFFSEEGQQLCQDRIVFLVPDGSVQP